MGDYGKLILLLLAIALVYLAGSGRGYAVYQVLTGRTKTAPPTPAADTPGPQQPILQPNPQNHTGQPVQA